MLDVKNLGKKYNGQYIIKDLSFRLNEKEFLTVLGPSGCGKTTLLNILSKIDYSYNGDVSFNINKKEISYFLQETILLPWIDAYDNISLPLKIRKAKPNSEKIFKLLSNIGLESYAFYYPNQLSGGMGRRVALACALINEPKLLILDEPLTGLDFRTKDEMIKLILKIFHDTEMTIIMTTHLIEDAVKMSDKILLMPESLKKNKAPLMIEISKPREMLHIDERVEYEQQIKIHYDD